MSNHPSLMFSIRLTMKRQQEKLKMFSFDVSEVSSICTFPKLYFMGKF